MRKRSWSSYTKAPGERPEATLSFFRVKFVLIHVFTFFTVRTQSKYPSKICDDFNGIQGFYLPPRRTSAFKCRE